MLAVLGSVLPLCLCVPTYCYLLLPLPQLPTAFACCYGYVYDVLVLLALLRGTILNRTKYY